MIVIEALGPVRLTVDGDPPAAELLWRKHLALLMYLARSPRRTRSRDHLIALLWPEKDASAARHSLNEALRILRRSLGDDVQATADQVGLAPGAVALDVERWAGLVDRDPAGAAAAIGGTFLEGFHVPGAPDFDRWLESERQQWTAWSIGVLTRWSATLLDRGHTADAATVAERAARLDPLSDAAMVAVLKPLGLRGDRAAALARFEAFAAGLRDQIGIEPSAEVTQMAARIRTQSGGQSRPSQGADDDSELRRLPLVEREMALSRLLARLQRSRQIRMAQVGMISGEFGGGKSRLLEEVAGRARLDGVVVISIRAVPGDRDQFESGLVGLLEGLGPNAPGVGGGSPAALAAIGRRLPDWAARFPGLGTASPEWSLVRSVVDLLRAVTVERPVLLQIDDAQWLDDESTRGVQTILRDLALAPLTVLMARSPTPHPVLDEIEVGAVVSALGDNIQLSRLTAEGVGRLVAGAFPRYQPSEVARLTRRLLIDSAGVPLFLVELIHAVGNGLDASGEPGPWPAPERTMSDTLPADLPGSIVAAFRIGYRRLSQPAQLALAAAAVLPDRVPADTIAATAALDSTAGLAALDELEWQRWLVAEPRGYSFVTRIAREVILRDMLTAGQRRRLEQRASAGLSA